MLFYTLPRLTDLFLFALDDARRAFELLLGIGDVVVVLADGFVEFVGARRRRGARPLPRLRPDEIIEGRARRARRAHGPRRRARAGPRRGGRVRVDAALREPLRARPPARRPAPRPRAGRAARARDAAKPSMLIVLLVLRAWYRSALLSPYPRPYNSNDTYMHHRVRIVRILTLSNPVYVQYVHTRCPPRSDARTRSRAFARASLARIVVRGGPRARR